MKEQFDFSGYYNMDLKSATIEQHILLYWGMDDANEMECENTLITEREYCEQWGFNWAEWYQLRRELYNRGEDEETIFGNN